MANFDAAKTQANFEPIEVTNLGASEGVEGRNYSVTQIPFGVIDEIRKVQEAADADLEPQVNFVSVVLGEEDKDFLRSTGLTMVCLVSAYLAKEIVKQMAGKDVNPTETGDGK